MGGTVIDCPTRLRRGLDHNRSLTVVSVFDPPGTFAGFSLPW